VKIRCVRADSGFFADGLRTFLELKQLPYIVDARLAGAVKRSCMGLQEWTALDENYAVGEVSLQLHGWQTKRRFVVLRERVRAGKAAVGRMLIEVPGYTDRIFVTNRTESAEVIRRDYNGRACIEQRIEELKNDLSAGGCCVREFHGTESAFLAGAVRLQPAQPRPTPDRSGPALPPTRHLARLSARCGRRSRLGRQTNRPQTFHGLRWPHQAQAPVG